MFPSHDQAGITKRADMAESAMLAMATRTVQAAQVIMPTAGTTTQSIDKSFNVDMNVTATPETPVTIAQRLAQVQALQG